MKGGKIREILEVLDEFSFGRIVHFHILIVFEFVKNGNFVLMLVMLDLLQKILD
jgi:hypothetical protein